MMWDYRSKISKGLCVLFVFYASLVYAESTNQWLSDLAREDGAGALYWMTHTPEIPPCKTTTGPVPPKGVQDKAAMKMALPTKGGTTKTISGVPAYLWRHGCGPTALGMVLGYYDTLGFSDIFPGDAYSQTEEVSQGIASQGSGVLGSGVQLHYEDYSLPLSDAPDRSENYPYGCHTDNSIADFMETSWSRNDTPYGGSWSYNMIPAFARYLTFRNPEYDISADEYTMDDPNALWAALTTEINNNRPMNFMVDCDGDGYTDHLVAVIAYSDGPPRQYGCYDTWEPVGRIRWCNFTYVRYGFPWGIAGGFSFSLKLPLVVEPVAHGKVSVTGNKEYYYAREIAVLTAKPDSGYRFTGWEGDVPEAQKEENPLSLLMDGIKHVRASFVVKRETRTLTYAAGENGLISGESPQAILQGDNGKAVEAVADPGYQFVQWSDGRRDNPRIEVNIAADLSVNAIFDVLPENTPLSPRVTDISATSITWSWQDNSDKEIGYQVWVSAGEEDPAGTPVVLDAGVYEWKQEGLSPNRQYAFKVATILPGDEAGAPTAFITAWTEALTPLAPVVGNITNTSLSLSIDTDDGNSAETLYALYCGSNSTWVQQDGSMDTFARWRTAAEWGAMGIQDLSEYRSYTFSAYAQSNGAILTAAGPATTSRTLDVTPPSGTIVINGNSLFATSASVELSLTYGDGNGSGVASMRFSNDNTAWSEWEPIKANKAWELNGEEDGDKTVYVQYKDASDNISTNSIADTISFDHTPPIPTITLMDNTPIQAYAVRYAVHFGETPATEFSIKNIQVVGALAATISVSGVTPDYEVTASFADTAADGKTAIALTGIQDMAGNSMQETLSPYYDIVYWPGFAAELTPGKYYSGQAATFDASLAAGGKRAATWQWMQKNMGGISIAGPNTAQWVIDPLTTAAAGAYFCEVNYGGLHFTTNKVSLEVADPIQITEPLIPQSVIAGGKAVLSVATSGGYAPLHFVWHKDESDISGGPDAAQYTIYPALPSSAGAYSVTISDSFSSRITTPAVTLTVRHGEPVNAPEVTGRTEAEAKTLLNAAGLFVGELSRVYHATIAAGKIIGQNPVAGAAMETGDSVNLEISKGREPVVVPDLVGMTRTAAAAELTRLGFVEGTVAFLESSFFAAGVVMQQSPKAGNHLTPGNAVSLVVAAGSSVFPEGESTSAPTLDELSAWLAGNTESLDKDNDGRITYAEAAAQWPTLSESLFNQLDTDSDGAVTAQELDQNTAGGCQCTKASIIGAGRKRLGDLFLMGLALVLLRVVHSRK